MGNHSAVPMDDQHLSILLQGCAAVFDRNDGGSDQTHYRSPSVWFLVIFVFSFPSLFLFVIVIAMTTSVCSLRHKL